MMTRRSSVPLCLQVSMTSDGATRVDLIAAAVMMPPRVSNSASDDLPHDGIVFADHDEICESRKRNKRRKVSLKSRVLQVPKQVDMLQIDFHELSADFERKVLRLIQI